MKTTWAAIGILILSSLATPAQTKPDQKAESVYFVKERGAHHKAWERIEHEPAIGGKLVPHRRGYEELATGLHFQNGLGDWEESKEEIEILPNNAGAVASKGQHKVVFPTEIKSGLIELQKPDGLWLRSRVWGLAYFDASTGESVLLAEVKESDGQVLGDNVVVYPDAFTDLRADLRLTYFRSGFEQDIVLRTRPPAPEEFGLNSKTTRLQVLTEFVEASQPTKSSRQAGELADQSLAFGQNDGQMTIGAGKAFSVDGEGETSGHVPVAKGWEQMEGRDFLIEEVLYEKIADQLQKLPAAGKYEGASLQRRGTGKTVIAGLQKIMLKRYAKAAPKPATKRMAKAAPDFSPGFVMDYLITLTSQTNYTFKGDTTYHVTGPVILSGTSTFEGNAAIKYSVAANAGITASNVVWQSASYRPVYFTSMHDDSVGETIAGSSGDPTTSFAGGIALNVSAQANPIITNARFSYLSNAVAGVEFTFQDVQFLYCNSGLTDNGYGVSDSTLRNVLIYRVGTFVDGGGGGNLIRAENVTARYCGDFSADTTGSTYLTNCLFVCVTNWQAGNTITNHSTFLNSDIGVFQTAGGGTHYLSTNSPYRNAGTANINAGLLANLKQKTTYPPIVYPDTDLADYGTLGPQATRGSDIPDLGYHYDPLDYIVGKVNVNYDLTFSAGTAVGWFRHDSDWYHAGHGLHVADSKTLSFAGRVESPCYYIHQITAQEGLVGYNPYDAGPGGITGWAGSQATQPKLDLEFTRFSLPAARNHIRDDYGSIKVSANHCEFYGGGLGGYVSDYGMTNCLLDRVQFWLSSGNTNYADINAFRNCTIRGGTFNSWRQSGNIGRVKMVVLDTAFDDTVIDTADAHYTNAALTTFSYNAFRTNANRTTPTNVNDVIVTNFNWQTSWLGSFYLPTNSPLTNTGSVAATAVGLYHFTSQTNQVKETNSTVDIGYHYVAVDSSGTPLDTDGDGTPDYIEDADGDGVVDAGETLWGLAILTQPQNQFGSAGSSVTLGVTATGIAPLNYQWKFNGTNITGATNSSLTFNPVSLTNVGTYNVIVTNVLGTLTSSNATLAVTCVPPPSGMIGWWQGESGSFDSISNQHGYFVSGSYTNGYQNNAFQFDGTNSYMMIPDAPGLRPTNLTVEAWVKFDSLYAKTTGGATTGYEYIAFKQNTRPSSYFAGFGLLKTPSHRFQFEVMGTAGESQNVWVTNAAAITSNVWYHVVGVRGSNYIQIYVNGKMEKQASVTFAQNYGNYPMYFGTTSNAWNGMFKGKLDEVAFYNRALSSNEVASLYLAGSIGKCPPAPKIIPSHLNALTNNAATFTVVGSGAAPVNYQWRYNGTNIAGATNANLAFTNLQLTNTGNYSVVLSNSQGVTTTSEALLVSACYPAVDVALVIDRSGSMIEGEDRLLAARIAGSNFVQNLNYANDQVALVTFATDCTTNQTLTNSESLLLQKIGQITNAAGETFMGNALLAAQTELTSSRHHSNAIPVLVFLTDGVPDDSTNSILTITTQIKNTGIHLITVGLGDDLSPAGLELLRAMASTTNNFYYATNTSQLTNIYHVIASSICRGTDPTNQPPDVTWIAPTNSQLFVTSPTNILLWAANTGGPMTSMEFYYNVTNHIGGTNAAPYQILWTNVVAGTYTLRVEGLNTNTGTSVSAYLTNIIVNAMPVVTNNAPTNLQEFEFIGSVNVGLTNTAWDPDAPGQYVTNLTFYTWSNSVAVKVPGTVNSNGFLWSQTWSGITNGYYSYYAVAEDNRGAASTSPIGVFKVNPTNTLPKVWITYPTNLITYPTNNLTFRAGADITITASTTNGSGTVTNVEFFSNGQLLGSDSTEPYSVTVCCWETGTYTNIAKVIDSFGAVGVSTNVVIVVGPKAPTSGEGYWDPVFPSQFFEAFGMMDAFEGYYSIGDALVDGNDLYLGINYRYLPASSAVVKWDGTNFTDVGNLVSYDRINAIYKKGQNLYVGVSPYFNDDSGIKQWDGTNWATLGDTISGGVYAIDIIGEDLYIGGAFIPTEGSDTNLYYLARWNSTLENWEAVAESLNGPVFAITSISNSLFVGGSFTGTATISNLNHVAQLDEGAWNGLSSGIRGTNGSNTTDSGFPACVYCLEPCGDKLFVGGSFNTAGELTEANSIAVWSGLEWSTIGRGVFSSDYFGENDEFSNLSSRVVHSIASSGNELYITGRFKGGVNPGSTNVVISHNVAKATWSNQGQQWVWNGLAEGIEARLIFEGADPREGGGFSVKIMGDGELNRYSVLVGGEFAFGDSGVMPAPMYGEPEYHIALWRVGFPSPEGPPHVTITLPESSVTYTNPGSIRFTGLAVSSTNISGGFFYTNGVVINGTLGELSPTNTFSFTNEWDSPEPGIYLLRAGAVDETGLWGQSKTIVVSVKDTNNVIMAIDDQYAIPANSTVINLNVITNDVPNQSLRIGSVIQTGTSLGRAARGHDGKYIIYAPLPNTYGTDIFYYSVTNTTGSVDSATVTVRILAYPEVSISNPNDLQRTNPPISSMTVSGTARDWDGVISNVVLYVNGDSNGPPIVPVGTSFSTNWSQTISGYYTFEAVVTDNDGLSTTSAPVTLVVTKTSTNLPVASISNLNATDNSQYGIESFDFPVISEGFFNLQGTASGDDPVSYQVLLYRPEDWQGAVDNLSEWVGEIEPFADITPGPKNYQGFHIGGDVGGNLGTNDLTGIPNGIYDLVLRVRGGTDETNAIVRVQIDSQLKIGQFSFSEQDLVLPVNGIPITVTRTYNSMNPLAADFGHSWTYALNSMDVQLNEQRESFTIGAADDRAVDADREEDENGRPLSVSIRTGGSRDVTLTLPDGRRTTFVFRPSIGSSSAIAKWEAPPGVTATLTPLSSDTIIILPCLIPSECVPPFWSDVGNNSNYENDDVKGWVLETQDGTKFYITRGLANNVRWDDTGDGHFINVRTYGPPKLTSIVQRSGDRIEISDTGVKHFAPGESEPSRSMFMQRDAADRITAIFDPNSGVTNEATALNAKALVKYVYNRDTGNLIQVHRLQDRTAGNYLATKYHYEHPKFPHYITSIEDPREIPLARNEYDDSGRLTAVVDADGKRTQFIHNITNNVEIITDRLGNTNSYVYDLLGNVTFTTNALKIVTAMGYNDPNHETMETAATNALGEATYTWTLYAYDEFGYQTNVVSSPNHTNSFRYDKFGNLLWQRDPAGNVTTNGYDGFGNLTNTVQLDAGGNPIAGSSSVYEDGHLKETRNFNGVLTASFDYDPSGNLTNTTDANDVSRSFAYDANGNQTNSSYLWTPPGGGSSTNVSSSTIYDAQGRVTMSIDALGNTNRTVYNALGRVDHTVDKFGNTNSFLYDPRGNLIRTIDAQGLTNYTVYDDAGRAFFTLDRSGITGTHTYFDAAGRATNVVRVTNAVVEIQAGPISVLTSDGDPISTNATEYLPNGWVKSRTGPNGAKTTYAYWPDGQTMYVTNVYSTNITFYKYDDAGRQEYVADALNRTNRFEYDAAGRMFKTVFHNGTYTSNYFNSLGQRTVVRDQAGRLTQFGYDVSGQLTNVIKPGVIDPQDSYHTNNPSWAYSYDDYGRLHHTTDPLNQSTTNSYDEFGREVSRWLPMGGDGTTNYYNQFGQLTNRFDFKGQRQTFKYDQFGRVTNTYFFAAGPSITYPSNSVAYYYNQLGQLTNITERWGADASAGYVASMGLPSGKGRHTRFAALLASLDQVPPGTKGGVLGFVLCGVVVACISREKRRRLAWCAGEVWRAHRLTLSASNEERAGVRCRIPLASYIIHLPSSWIAALIALCSFAIYVLRCGGTPDGTPKRLRLPSYGWRLATIITLVALIGSDPHFDGLWTARAACGDEPNTIALNDTVRSTNFTYDLEGRLAQVNSPEGYINYEYDLATGRHTSTCTAKSKVAYGYDDLGRLQTVHVLKRNGDPVDETTTYTYTAVGSRNTVALPNGVVTTWQYDELNRLTNVANVKTNGNELLSQFSYKLDLSGRRTNAVEIIKQESGSPAYQTNTMTWQYDGMYRLTNEVCVTMVSSASYTNRFQYDLNGNRWSQEQINSAGTSTTTNLYNANDQLLKEVTLVSGSPTVTNLYAYDDNGSMVAKTNLATSGSTNLYSYDLKNKLTSSAVFKGSWATNRYTYNEQGIRVQTTPSSGIPSLYLVDGNNHTGYALVLEEFEVIGGAPTLMQSYVIGDDVLAQGVSSASYLLYDGHGSTRQLASNTGSVTSRYNYDAYGTTLTATSSMSAEDSVNNNVTSLLYCGEQYDAGLQMYNLRARFYNPSNGRFNARDTFGGNASDPQSLHKYAYCHNDPINGIDPSGNMSLTELGSTIGILAAVGATIGVAVNGLNNYALGNPFWQGAGKAALGGAVMMNLVYAFPFLGLILAGLGITLSAQTAYQVFRGDSSNGQKGAALLLVGLSLWGAYGAARNVQESGLWLNTQAFGSIISAASKVPVFARMIESIRNRIEQFQETLQGTPLEGRITVAVGIAEDASGNPIVLIGTSEPNGYIRPRLQELIQPGDVVVKGTGHAEADIAAHVAANGLKLIGIGATRPVCGSCAAELAGTGATVATPLKDPNPLWTDF